MRYPSPSALTFRGTSPRVGSGTARSPIPAGRNRRGGAWWLLLLLASLPLFVAVLVLMPDDKPRSPEVSVSKPPSVSAPRQSGLGLPNGKGPGVHKPDVKVPEAHGPGIDGPDVGSGGPSVGSPSVDEPDATISFEDWLVDFFKFVWAVTWITLWMPWWLLLIIFLIGRWILIIWRRRKKEKEEQEKRRVEAEHRRRFETGRVAS